MRLFRFRAWEDGFGETAALFSAALELVCTTAEISLVPFSAREIISA
ncbi:MAG: hypothetical protein HFF62_10190 [Oscillospiraceae bacterium]|jgi:hypothetical protein|nr:hypothetical protein [Oscillospiraceae bacterium]